ncbi:MAG TPA: FG-GAP-like repeat-containing protein, partial [archaeon]|nr:FG-GAP-like repeat-containing protein [archaeon]
MGLVHLVKRIAIGGGMLISAGGLVSGCAPADIRAEDNTPQADARAPAQHVAEVPMWYQSGMALTSGDFDGDGDQDLVVGAHKYPSGGQLYLVRNEAGMLSLPRPFAEVPMWYESGMALESADFDGDGV